MSLNSVPDSVADGFSGSLSDEKPAVSLFISEFCLDKILSLAIFLMMSWNCEPATEEDDLPGSEDAAEGSGSQDTEKIPGSEQVVEETPAEGELDGDAMKSDKDGAD